MFLFLIENPKPTTPPPLVQDLVRDLEEHMAIVDESEKPPVETCAADCPSESCNKDQRTSVPSPQVEPKEKSSVSYFIKVS